MSNEYQSAFLDAAVSTIEANQSPNAIKSPTDFVLPFCEGDTSVARFASSVQRSLENLDEELSRFENQFSGKNNTVFWASTYEDVFSCLKKLFKSYKVKSVRLPNIQSSTIFREIGIKYFLSDEKIALRDDGDIQFFVADMMFSDTGSLLLLNQSNNTLAKLTNSRTNVFFTTIDRICNNTDWAEVYQQLACPDNGGNRQDMLLFKTSENCNTYLFIVDNQRSKLLAHPELRQALSCTHCGRCKAVCPVFQTIGDVPYNNVFSGPIANVLLPYFETFDSYKHLAYCCTLCGRCEEVCPLSLPIRDMLLNTRSKLLSEGLLDKADRRLLAVLRKYALSRPKLNSAAFVKRHLLCKHISSEFKKSRKLPAFSKEPFNKSIKANE